MTRDILYQGGVNTGEWALCQDDEQEKYTGGKTKTEKISAID